MSEEKAEKIPEDKIVMGDTLEGQDCPMCGKKTLTLREMKREIPYFGNVFILSMTCSTCKYHKSDIECEEKRDPCKCTFEVSSEDDMKVRIIKSADATVKIPRVVTIESGAGSTGYITNVEGLLTRVKNIIEQTRDNEEDPAAKKKAKKLLKKIQKVMWGQDSLTIIIEDKTGNSAIISEKTKVQKIKP